MEAPQNEHPQVLRRTPMYHHHIRLQAKMEILAEWLIPGTYRTVPAEIETMRRAVGIIDVSFRGKLHLIGQDSLNVLGATMAQNVRSVSNPVNLGADTFYFPMGPDEFIVTISPDATSQMISDLGSVIATLEKRVTLLDVTSGWVNLVLVGPRSASLLSKLCDLDLRPDRFPDHASVITMVAGIRGLVARYDIQMTQTYQVYAAWSFGAYLWDVLLDAGKALGATPAGIRSLSQLASR